jgi:hypothetical protein
MNKALGILAFLGALAAVGEAAYIASMRTSMSQLRDRLDRVESRQRDLAAKAEVEAVEERVAKTETAAAEAKKAAVEAKSMPRSAAAPPGESGPGVSPDEIAEMIDKKVDEKVKAKGEDNGFGGKKRPLADVAKELELSHEVQVAMAAEVNKAKQESFEILKTPRDDGGNLVDDILGALKSDKPQENMQAQFMRIFKENVPGSSETYLAVVMKISDNVLKRFENILTPEQLTKFKHTGVGPLDLETGFDPFADYMKNAGK